VTFAVKYKRALIGTSKMESSVIFEENLKAWQKYSDPVNEFRRQGCALDTNNQ
jgi:hypothetical protein